MDVQSAQSPYTPAGGGPLPSMNPPVLGPQVPGMSGGLPALSGLSVTSNPMVDHLRAQGRGGDSTLVHMNPEEISGLQALALSQGTSMTINPVTGLPEAFSLGKIFKKLLPTLLGVGLNFILPGSGIVAQLGGRAATAGLMTGLGSLALTGSLKKGLMAGLGAFGGASLAGGIQGAVSGAAAPTTGATTAATAAPAATTVAPAAIDATSLAANLPGVTAGNLGTAVANNTLGAMGIGGAPIAANAAGLAANIPNVAAPALKTGLAGFSQGFADTARGSMTGILGKAAVPMAISGNLNALNSVSAGGSKTPGGQIDNSYTGPYYAQERRQISDPEGPLSSKQRRHFENVMPEIYDMQGRLVNIGSDTKPGDLIYQPVLNKKAKKGQNQYTWMAMPFGQPMTQEMMAQQTPQTSWERTMFGLKRPVEEYSYGFAGGGEVPMDDGAFVMDARSVSEIGNGSSNAGKELLARIGGRPIEGPGDGVSDSVPANIGGTQKARVARDEVVFPADAVRQIGKGSPERGTQKLYALMEKAHKARKSAGRGQDTRLRKGLA